MQDQYYSGTVEAYSDRSGFGMIVPDEQDRPGEKYLLHRNSLRDRTTLLESGTRVQFRKEIVPMGTLASDVHEERPTPTPVGDSGPFNATETEFGVVANLLRIKRYGFIRRPTGTNVFFHFNNLLRPGAIPEEGTLVEYELANTAKGPEAFNVTARGQDDPAISGPTAAPAARRARRSRRIFSQRTRRVPDGFEEGLHEDLRFSAADRTRTDGNTTDAPPGEDASDSNNILAQAILARDARQLDKAASLYRLGMRQGPTVQLVLSYAAMEKNRNRPHEAMRIFEEGIKTLQHNAKLREDAGVLAASLKDYLKAVSLLQEALTLYRSRGAGETQVLQWLARVHYQMGSRDDLLQAIRYFEEVHALIPRYRISTSDTLSMNLARIRTQHSRGALTFKLLTQVGCVIHRADLHDQTTVGADLVVEFVDQELKESYGISGEILVRCMFQTRITRHDLESFDLKIRSLGESGMVDEQLGLLIVASLDQNVESLLFTRIADRRRSQPAIIPVTQKEIEDAPDGLSSLRDIFNKWIYRRDLFAVNSPVVGRRFFGRDRQLAQLRDVIATGACTGVFGLRKVGKTSLLRETARRLSEAGDIVAFVDLLRLPDGVTDARWIYWKVAIELEGQATRLGLRGIKWHLGQGHPDFFEIPPDFQVSVAFDADLNNLLRALRTSGISPQPKVAVLLDEIEQLLPNEQGRSGFTGYFDFLGYLRGTSQETADFVVIITGANAAVAEVGQFGGRDNPVFNFFGEIYLPLLEPTECDLMITSLGRGMGLTFDDQALRSVYALTGGHPFFARHLCSYVAERFPERPLRVSLTLVEGLIDGYVEFSASNFAEIVERLVRDYPKEFDTLRQLAVRGGVGTLDQIRVHRDRVGMSLKHLLGYQLVRLQGNRVSLTMDLFRRWLIWSGA